VQRRRHFEGRKKGEACSQQNLLKSKHSHHNVGFLPKAAPLFNLIPLGATRFFCVHATRKLHFGPARYSNFVRHRARSGFGRRFGGQCLIIKGQPTNLAELQVFWGDNKGQSVFRCTPREAFFNNYAYAGAHAKTTHCLW
jgi:hypothetical protein